MLYGRRWLPVLASVLTGLGFLNSHLAGLVLIGLLPFIFYTQRAKNLSRRQILFDCWLAALVFSLIAAAWTLQTAPATWVDLHGGMSVLTKIIMWLGIAVSASLGFGLTMGLFVSAAKHRPVRLMIALPFAWALAELVRSYGLAIFLAGPGSSLSPNWNFGVLGLAVAATPLAYISRFVGLYGLSAVAVAVNLAVYLAVSRRYKTATAIATVIILLNFLAWRLYTPSSSQTIKVAAVYLQAADASLNPWGQVALPAKDTTVLVLPEYSHFFENPQSEKFAQTHFGAKTIVVTTQKGQGQPPANNLIYYSNQTGYASVQSKTFLAAYGEYMPYGASGLLKILGQQSALDTFKRDSQVQRGSLPEHAVQINGLKVGGLACSGVLNLNEYRQLAHQGADVLTNSASLSLLNTASLYRVQELYQNRFHAIANAKPFVQSARSGQAYILSSDGKVLARSNGRTGLLEATVPLQPKRTFYSWLP